jgi:hypothetical protein
MARKRHANMRQALLLAFAAGALTGAAGTTMLRRRQQEDDIRAAATVGRSGETDLPSLGGRLEGPAPDTLRAPAAQ